MAAKMPRTRNGKSASRNTESGSNRWRAADAPTVDSSITPSIGSIPADLAAGEVLVDRNCRPQILLGKQPTNNGSWAVLLRSWCESAPVGFDSRASCAKIGCCTDGGTSSPGNPRRHWVQNLL